MCIGRTESGVLATWRTWSSIFTFSIMSIGHAVEHELKSWRRWFLVHPRRTFVQTTWPGRIFESRVAVLYIVVPCHEWWSFALSWRSVSSMFLISSSIGSGQIRTDVHQSCLFYAYQSVDSLMLSERLVRPTYLPEASDDLFLASCSSAIFLIVVSSNVWYVVVVIWFNLYTS